MGIFLSIYTKNEKTLNSVRKERCGVAGLNAVIVLHFGVVAGVCETNNKEGSGPYATV